jgi:hypothetical protein
LNLNKIEFKGQMDIDVTIKKHEVFLSELQTVDSLKDDKFSLLIYGQGGQTKSFYNKLANDPDVTLCWTGCSGPKWMRILSFIPSQGGLLKVNNIGRIKKLYENVGQQSCCGLYFLPKNIASKIILAVRSSPFKFWKEMKLSSFLEGETEFFILDTFFDTDEDFYHVELKYGEGLDPNIQNKLIALIE